MKKHIRKPMLFLAAFLAIALAYFLPGKGALAHAEESDAGGTRAEAKVIELGKTYSEMASSSDDEDFFKFTTTERGYFQVDLKHNAADSNDPGDGWDVFVLDENGGTLNAFTGTKTGSSIILPYAKAGRDFYVRVVPRHGSIGCIYDLTVKQTAAGDWEAESNGTRDTANEIEVNKTYHGITVDSSDEDYFKVTTTAHGYFQVDLKHNAADSNDPGDGWEIYVQDASGEALNSFASVENGSSIVLPFAESGRTFYVRIVPRHGSTYSIYDLTIRQTAASDWEAEPNGTIAAATGIQVNKTYHGITVDSNDEDYFRFTTTARGYFQVNLAQNANDSTDAGNGWDVRILDRAGNEIISGSFNKNWNSMVLPYAKAGEAFYIRIVPRHGSTYSAYQLTVQQKATAVWESEPDGSMKTATSIKAGKTYNGITETGSDEDYFKLSMPASGKLKVRISSHNSNPSGSIGEGWDAVIYDRKSNEVTRVRGVKTAGSVSFDVKKGAYYIKIAPCSSWSAPVGCRYTLLADYTKAPAAPKISSVKAGKKSAVVKWKKASGATGYYVYRSTSPKGGFKKVQTLKRASALSWKNKKLKSGRKYYYKVAAYKKVKGMTVVSPYSAVKSVKVK